jgi:DNA polymerase III epsilon subunit-like protein
MPIDPTVYFSVDVETTGPRPGFGSLLSIGACTLNGKNDNDHFYGVIDPKPMICDPDTMSWWMTLNSDRWNEATNYSIDQNSVASDLEDWVEWQALSRPVCFVANPSAFDFPWIDWMFLCADIKNPFGHRALCLRSMLFGMTDMEWGGERTEWGKYEVKPEVPHNALSDALAQREELKLFLKRKHELAELSAQALTR